MANYKPPSEHRVLLSVTVEPKTKEHVAKMAAKTKQTVSAYVNEALKKKKP